MNILKAFEKSMGEYEAVQKSKHWQKFDKRKHLYNEESLENFRNNDLSEGLDDQYSEAEQKEIFQDLIREVGKDFVFANLTDKNIGNSRQCFIQGDKVVDGGQNFHIKWLRELETYVFSKRKINYVCEIGGGYGSLAQKIRAKYPCKYVLIDLPEANLLSSYYLLKHFPDLKFLLSDSIVNKLVTKKQVDENDFIIIPPWYEIEGVKFDLFINTRSMMEMNYKVIKKYFDFIQKNIALGGFFFNINRYRKESVGYPIELSKYPYDKNWKVISSKTSWRQKLIHQLVTQRQDTSGDINQELRKIDTIASKLGMKKKIRSFSDLVSRVRQVINRFRYQ